MLIRAGHRRASIGAHDSFCGISFLCLCILLTYRVGQVLEVLQPWIHARDKVSSISKIEIKVKMNRSSASLNSITGCIIILAGHVADYPKLDSYGRSCRRRKGTTRAVISASRSAPVRLGRLMNV